VLSCEPRANINCISSLRNTLRRFELSLEQDLVMEVESMFIQMDVEVMESMTCHSLVQVVKVEPCR
jgi:hypothetical protein